MTLKIIVKGKASGEVMVAKKPINFLGAIDKIGRASCRERV